LIEDIEIIDSPDFVNYLRTKREALERKL
jgi:hypothetical protein